MGKIHESFNEMKKASFFLSNRNNNSNIYYNDGFYNSGPLSSCPCKLLNRVLFLFSLKKAL